jgi:hypothetical protein
MTAAPLLRLRSEVAKQKTHERLEEVKQAKRCPDRE